MYQYAAVARQDDSLFARRNVRDVPVMEMVVIKHVETEHAQAGSRVFSVKAEGTEVISNLDICAVAGPNIAVERTVEGVVVNDGTIDLFFSASADQPILQGIRIERLTSGIGERLEVEEGVGGGIGMTVYPNPFNDRLQVSLDQELEGDVTLVLLNGLGHVVKQLTLAARSLEPGQTITLKTGELAPGMYYCRVATDRFVVVKKVMLTR